MSDESRPEEPIDRSKWPVRIAHLHDDVDESADYAHLTPGQRIDMVEELTRTAWAFYTGSSDESQVRRDVVRVVRGAR